MPVLSGFFFYFRRKSIFSASGSSFWGGSALIVLGAILHMVLSRAVANLSQNDRLSLAMFSALVILMGILALFYGFGTLKRVALPFLLLFFMVPLPDALVGCIVGLLQKGSAEMVGLFLNVLGIPVLREGYIFHLSRLSIVVAEQCSGIRSTIALVITTIMAANLFVAKGWIRWLVVMSVIPLALVKNAVRILTISLAANYYDARFLESSLHRKGGIVFFIFALCLLWGLIVGLRKADKRYRAGV